jgi:threonine/homoserine/homoserine lactone efflux protein
VNLDLYITFVLIATGMILIPGPNVLLIVSNSIAHGSRSGLRTVFGTSSAMVIQLAVTTLGMTSLMVVLSESFQWLRWIGVAYLVWLGVQQWRCPPKNSADHLVASSSPRRAYWQGFTVSMTNPKTLLFFGAFLPQFVDPALPALPQMAALSVSFVILATTFDSAYALVGGRFRGSLEDPQRIRFRKRVTGSLLIGAGIGLALARRS